MALFGPKKDKEGSKPQQTPTQQPVASGGKAADASDFDSPVESVSLSAAAAKPKRDDRSDRVAREAAEEAERALRDYGIEQAIALMRLLPHEANTELVVQVVKKTLESTNIRVPKIIEDAARKERDLDARVGQLEREIQVREAEIERHQKDRAETTTVKERLQLAEQLAWAGQQAQQPGGGGSEPPAPPPLQDPEGKQTGEEALTTPARLGAGT